MRSRRATCCQTNSVWPTACVSPWRRPAGLRFGAGSGRQLGCRAAPGRIHPAGRVGHPSRLSAWNGISWPHWTAKARTRCGRASGSWCAPTTRWCWWLGGQAVIAHGVGDQPPVPSGDGTGDALREALFAQISQGLASVLHTGIDAFGHGGGTRHPAWGDARPPWRRRRRPAGPHAGRDDAAARRCQRLRRGWLAVRMAIARAATAGARAPRAQPRHRAARARNEPAVDRAPAVSVQPRR